MNKIFTVLGILFTSGFFLIFSISCAKVTPIIGIKSQPTASSASSSNTKSIQTLSPELEETSSTVSSSNVKVIQRKFPTNFSDSYGTIKDGLASIGLTSFDLVKSGFNKEETYTDSNGKSYRIRGDLTSTMSNDKTTLNGAIAVFNGVSEVLLHFDNLVVSSENGKIKTHSGKVLISFYENDLAKKYSLQEIFDFKKSKLDGKTSISCSQNEAQKCTELFQAQTKRISENGCGHLIKFLQ